MSRVGKSQIEIPSGVTITKSEGSVIVKGPKGESSVVLDRNLEVAETDNYIEIKRKNEDKYTKSIHGTTRALIANMVIGLTKGWDRQLEMIGTGYRAEVRGKDLVLNVGFSHPVTITPPEGVDFKVEKNLITVSGSSKEAVGQVAADIRKVRPPEPYKGKGIKYVDEMIRRKPGKAAKAAEGA